MLAFTVRLQAEGRCLVVTAQAYLYTLVRVGASVIYADTVADLGYADELGNYAEYSGAPNQQVIKLWHNIANALQAARSDLYSSAVLHL